MTDELDFTLKKKKKKVLVTTTDGDDIVLVKKHKVVEDLLPSIGEVDNNEPLTYEDMLGRIYNIISNNNPDIVRPEDAVIRLKPVKVARVGTAKTAFINFMEECRCMNRDPEHLSRFFAVETGSKTSINEDNQLLLRGKYSIQNIENILRRYINDYVKCLVCKSGNTRLDRDARNRLMFLKCDNCASQRSVAPIAVTTTDTQDA
jgi:translation initiation factor 2 beta subunit (eIF-2beta)/eIF-5